MNYVETPITRYYIFLLLHRTPILLQFVAVRYGVGTGYLKRKPSFDSDSFKVVARVLFV